MNQLRTPPLLANYPRVAINGHLGGEGPPPDLEIKVGRFGKKLAGLGKSWQVGEKVGRFR